MSAIGGKADVRELPSECLLIAKSGHSGVQSRGHRVPWKFGASSSISVLGLHGLSEPDRPILFIGVSPKGGWVS